MKKFSKKLIWYKLIINLFSAFLFGLVVLSALLPEEDVELDLETIRMEIIKAFASVIVLYVVSVIYQILYYRSSGYELRENEIICVKGVLFKKKSILEYKKIHAINSKQNIIEKLIGISTLQVDSGSTNTAHTAEIQIIEEDSIVNELIRIIKAKQNNEEVLIPQNNEIENKKIEESNKVIDSIYNFDSKRKAIYTALQVAWVIVIGFVAAIFGIFVMLVLLLLKEMDIPLFLIILGVAFVVIIIISIISFIFGLIGSLITFYDFKLIRSKNDIEVSYGLITKIKNTFKYNKIKAIRISQSIIQKIFGFVTVRIEVIGYTVQTESNKQTQTTGMLIPLCKKSEVNTILENLLPNYIPLEREVKAKNYIPFISYHLLFSFIPFALIQIIAAIVLCYYKEFELLLILSGILWSSYLAYISIVLVERKFAQINSGFSLKDGKLCIFRGSFVQETIVMRRQNIIGIDSRTTHYRKKKDIYTYKIHFRTNAFTNTVAVLNVNKNEGEKIYELIRY